MKLLAAACYDPAVAVSKSTATAIAMTALDTTNLRLSFTVPSSGMVRVRMAGTLHGATTCPQIMLGVLEGSTVRGRVSPMHGGTNIAATSLVKAEAEFIVTGLTPGAALTWDAAYGVETVVASTGLKYGGPNNTTANDAFGGFAFEVWDVTTVGTAGASAADVWTYATRVLTAGTNIALAKGTGVTGFNDITTANVRTELATELARIDAAVSSRLASAGYTAPDNAGITTLTGRLTAGRATALDNLDATVSSRLAAASYVAPTTPPSAAAIRAEIDANSTKLDAAVSSRLAATAYTDPDNTGIAAVKAKTDQLNFTVPNRLSVDVYCINGVTITGAGTTSDKWRPAV